MAGATKAQGLAWRRRQGAGPSEKAMAQVRSDLDDAIRAKRAAEAATPAKMPAPRYPGDSASLAEKKAWAHQVELWDQSRPRTEVEKEFELQMAGVRHSFEKGGTDWYGPASVCMVMTTSIDLTNQLKAATARINALEKQAVKLQEVVTHAEKHSLRFAGTFDLSNSYSEGAICRFKEMLFIALKDIPANKTFPPREGSGWAPFS